MDYLQTLYTYLGGYIHVSAVTIGHVNISLLLYYSDRLPMVYALTQ